MTSTARIERSRVTRLALRGSDAKDFVHRVSSNDVLSLSRGEGCATLLLERTGRFVDRLIVADRGDDLLLLGSPGRGQAVREHLEKLLFVEEVQVENLEESLGLTTVSGDDSTAVLGGALSVSLSDLPRFHCRGADGLTVVRAEDIGGQSFHVLHTEDGAERIAGIPEMQESEWLARRVASGVPEFGAEYDASNVALEARMLDAISFTKGCYPGQEIVARIRTYGQVKRALVRLRVEGDEVPKSGVELMDAGEKVGEIASAARVGASVLALGWVRSGRENPGTRLALGGGANACGVEVLTLTPAGDPQ